MTQSSASWSMRRSTWARSDECRLSAMNASSTVQLTFDDLRIPKIGTLAASRTHRDSSDRRLRVNGSLHLESLVDVVTPRSNVVDDEFAVVERTRSVRTTDIAVSALVQPNSQCALLTCWPLRGVVRRFPVTSPTYDSQAALLLVFASRRRSRMRFSIS